MGVRIKMNTAQLEARIRQEGLRAMENGARALRRVAVDIQKRAIDNAPRDDGDLENAIKIEERLDQARRKTFTVYVDPDAPVTGENDDKTVGDYAAIMEEGYYNLGPESERKAQTGKNVGRRFFVRAYREGTARAKQVVAAAVKSGLEGGGRIAPGVKPIRRYDDGEE